MVDLKVALLHSRTSKKLKATAWGLNQYLSLSPGEVLLRDGLNPGGVGLHLFLVLIWYGTFAYTCNLSALDFVSGR